MHPFWEELLRYLHVSLLAELNLTIDTLHVFIQNGILTKAQMLEICSHPHTDERNDAFLYYFMRCPPDKSLYPLLLQAHPKIKHDVRNSIKNPSLRYRLRQALRVTTCPRCTILKYTRCESLVEELRDIRLLEQRTIRNYQQRTHLPDEWQINLLFKELFADQTMSTPENMEKVKQCLVRVLSPRSPQLARNVASMNPFLLLSCYCGDAEKSGDHDILKRPGSTRNDALGVLSPDGTTLGSRAKSLIKILIDLWSLHHHNHWHHLRLFMECLCQENHQDPDIQTLLTVHRAQVLYYRGKNEEALAQLSSFEAEVKGATEKTLLRVYYDTVRAALYRRLGWFEQACAAVQEALHAIHMLIRSNPAYALLQAAYAVHHIHILHRSHFAATKMKSRLQIDGACTTAVYKESHGDAFVGNKLSGNRLRA